MNQEQVIYGSIARYNPAPMVKDPIICLEGKSINKQQLYLNNDILSKALLVLGASGCGKTNEFFKIIDQLKKRMTNEDVMVIFDSKGDFIEHFYQKGDYVIGNALDYRDISMHWNIFDEVLVDGWDDEIIKCNTREIATSLFKDHVSSTQPFFSDAARDIFTSIVIYFIRRAKVYPEYKNRLNNADLIRAFNSYTIEDYKKIFNSSEDLKYCNQFFGDGKFQQALGVFGTLNTMLSSFFIGVFASKDREISMRKFINNKGGKILFIEYDLSCGEVLTPIYRVLIDQIIKEALSKKDSKDHNIYLILDEFKLCPSAHIDDALNFGRSKSMKIVAGVQSIDQLYEIYGQDKGTVLASAFGSIMAFATNDGASRKYVQERFGKNITYYTYLNAITGNRDTKEREGYVVEEWDMVELGLGQAFVKLGYDKPFLYQFNKYGGK